MITVILYVWNRHLTFCHLCVILGYRGGRRGFGGRRNFGRYGGGGYGGYPGGGYGHGGGYGGGQSQSVSNSVNAQSVGNQGA